MGAVSAAIAAAARAAGAEVRTEVPVARIVVRDGRTRGVVLDDGTTFDAGIVLSNAHPFTTFGDLLESGDVPPAIAERLRGWRSEGVSLKLNLALGELPNFSARPGSAPAPHHRATIHVAPSIDYLQQAHDDARRGGVSRAPMLECFMQTPTDPDLAPPGKHLLSIFAQYYPYGRADAPWDDATRAAAADSIVATLAHHAPNLPCAIEARQILAPPDLESRFGLRGGHIFHGELLPGQILDQRFPTETGIEGLYLCGSGASPGGCVTGVPGVRAARAVMKRMAVAASR
jgi:phytoene dehydrogenase-like protein